MNIILIVGLKFFFDLSDVVYTQLVYITYNMGNRDLPDIYAHALGPAALGLGHIYQANPSCPCYNFIYIYIYVSYNTVVLYSRDQYEIIGLRKSSHSVKQPCSSICQKKAFAIHQSC